jgi:hypothetical protein
VDAGRFRGVLWFVVLAYNIDAKFLGCEVSKDLMR